MPTGYYLISATSPGCLCEILIPSHFFLTILSQFSCQTESALIYIDQLFDCLQAEELYGPRVSPPSLRGVFFIFFSIPH